MEVTQEYVKVLGGEMKSRDVRHLNMSFLKQVFFGLAEMIVLKAKQMRGIAVANKEAEKYFEELRTCVDPARIKVLVDIIELTVLKDIPQLSFGGSQEHLNASAYDDEVHSYVGGHFRYFFVCLGITY